MSSSIKRHWGMLEIEKNFTWSCFNLVIALVLLDTESLATSKYKSRHMALWITLNVMVQHFVMVKHLCARRDICPPVSTCWSWQTSSWCPSPWTRCQCPGETTYTFYRQIYTVQLSLSPVFYFLPSSFWTFVTTFFFGPRFWAWGLLW